MKKPIIYTSKHLSIDSNTKSVAKGIIDALKELHVEHRELETTEKNYWCRDYMPVKISDDGCYSRFIYKPDYLVEYKTYEKTIVNQENASQKLPIYSPNNIDIVFDGGNYVRCGNKVIMTDKIFSENPDWSNSKLLQHLEQVFDAEIVLLPWDMKDFCGHTDGMVAPINDRKILLNGCWKEKAKTFHNRLIKILDKHFDIEELPAWKGSESWCYLNYLQVNGGILLPCLTEKCDGEIDSAAIEFFKQQQLFPNLEIKPIYAKPLIKKGGAIHCVTWEYIER